MTAYYNENDPFAAAWLRNLIAENLIAPGEVDERDIRDVRPSDLVGFDQCHFFAGIGGWSLALRLAGVPDDFRCWTGSCPCQPFSAAGKGGGFDDERHLWPDWLWLIDQCRPPIVFGEQVDKAVGWGWLDLVCADLEGSGYACGAVVLPAASVGATHIRQRLWIVADSGGDGQQGKRNRSDAGTPQNDGAWRPSGRTPAPHPAYAKRREWTLGGEAGRVGRENTISWNGGWEVAPEPFLRLGANGFPSRMGRLRAYGNAIVPQVAAEFIKAALDL